MEENRILRLKEVVKLTGMPVSSIYFNMKKGTFPKQVKLTVKSVGWRAGAIDEYLKSRVEVS